ncbi:UNVERIFIED_CONTAM: hypothetical protein Sradi_5202400 [Sesamum radiatum]|uniref:F-box domain-containing protein n=1 Tax=Sesamum radiatum TaxID=300843 RepID=A0AAW2M790_SESRA
MVKFCKRLTTIRFTGAERRRPLLDVFLYERSTQRLSNAKEETESQDFETEVQNQVTLPHDLLFKIFGLVHAESLFRLQFVCKKWFGLINTSTFIRHHSQQSETVLICKTLTLLESGSREDSIKSYFHFLHLDHRDDFFIESSVIDLLVDIRASCDGLLLAAVGKNKNLILINPITRKHSAFPLGFVANSSDESYGIAFCNKTNTYKVVHLFREKSGCTGCEILSISARKWTRVEGPNSSDLLPNIRKSPLSIHGSLHWMPMEHRCDHIITMNVKDEKFIAKKPPVRWAVKDRLIEIGGNLGFVSHAEANAMQVWILKNDGGSSEKWMKHYSIKLEFYFGCPIPICGSRNGREIVFECRGYDLCFYKFDKGEMEVVHSRHDNDEAWCERIEQLYIPPSPHPCIRPG